MSEDDISFLNETVHIVRRNSLEEGGLSRAADMIEEINYFFF